MLPRAAPSRYAQAYAVGCVLRACALLQAPESGLQAGLAAYELPAEEPSPEDVPEVSVPAELDGEEVWAAEPDDDDCAYEALESLASCTVTSGCPCSTTRCRSRGRFGARRASPRGAS